MKHDCVTYCDDIGDIATFCLCKTNGQERTSPNILKTSNTHAVNRPRERCLNIVCGFRRTYRDAANPGMNMVVVEGGPKAVRAYAKLMTRRIRWGEEDYGGGDSDSDRYEHRAGILFPQGRVFSILL